MLQDSVMKLLLALLLPFQYILSFHFNVFKYLTWFQNIGLNITHKIIITLYVTRPAKTGHVGTNYTLSLYKSYLSTGIEHFCFVTYIIMPNKFVLSAENFIAMACLDKKLWVQKDWKSRQKSCAHMPCFCRPGHILCCKSYALYGLFTPFIAIKGIAALNNDCNKCDDYRQLEMLSLVKITLNVTFGLIYKLCSYTGKYGNFFFR